MQRSRTRRSIERVIAGFSIVILVACLLHRREPCPELRMDLPEVRVPLHVAEGLPFVDVRVDGKGPFRFLFDTGASLKISQRLADQLPLRRLPSRTYRVRDASDRETTQETHMVAVDELALGGARLLGAQMPVADFSTLRLGYPMGFEGLIGVSCFDSILVTVDSHRSELVLANGRLPEPDGRVVFRLLDEQRPTITVQVDGGNGRRFLIPVLIDTGNAGSLKIPESVAKRVRFYPPRRISEVPVFGKQLLTRVSSRMIGSVWIGDREIVDPIASWSPGLPGLGILGAQILSRFRITLDQQSGAARFVPNGSTPIRIPAIKTIGLILTLEGRGARITALEPCAREAAKLVKVGDFIATINARPVSEYDEYRLRELLAGARGALNLSIVRSGRLHNVTVPVVEAVP